ncbi:Putative diacyglycerol O-acyltransferase [Zhongshania aliphaticivorans]|uniref:diacylglycerol O-acyltransferase n=1 Tax=Zhongshania aliphaticivorans TaxID=1470434 RepID=A0A5S9MZG4_9GAMM|nr:wax ester/triacylglycerol synthase family O-acyltransferase [Zhongshania aliphaticivorans]CAA0082107.1 Putative diacyglycerol O-acyltransferase [Zhongshania aliphaticivorans]CAA0084572.1 Putative diacyglycerol O-acyltransferase [Zhongshania aliphaticivorans]
MQQLSGQDAMFIHTESMGIPQHIGILSIYDQSTAPNGLVRFKQILQLLENRSHLSPIFNRRLRRVPLNLDQPYWEDVEHADIETHVHHIALPKPGDWRQLCILASRIHARPLDTNKPLWEMYVIEGLDSVRDLPKGCFAVMSKVHHAAMDGATGARFIPLLHDLSPNVSVVDDTPTKIVQKYNNGHMLSKALANNLKKPGQFFSLIGSAIPSWRRIQRGKKEQDFSTLEDKQKTIFQGKISPYRVCDAVPFPFEDIRAIKNTVAGATINDAMLCIVSGGLRKYLAAKNALPEKTLVSGCPIDVRSNNEQSSGGNMVGFMTVSLHSDINDPKERLKAIHDASMSSKAYADALGPRMAVDVTNVLPGGMLSLALRAASATGLTEAAVIFNTIVTNVPGPTQQLYFCGAKMVDGMNFGPLLPNVGLFQIVYSSVMDKVGTISISFTACRKMLPDPELYSACLQASFEELKAACLNNKT